MADSFFENKEFFRTEMAILEQSLHYTDGGDKKFTIPVLTPLMTGDVNVTIRSQKVLNKDDISKLGISSVKLTPTVLMKIPEYIREHLPRDINGYIHPGIKFIITFVGGDVTKPRIIGVY